MQLCQGQTPDSRSPPQHYWVFKPLRPCGNSQFDDADLQCWPPTIILRIKKRMSFTTLSPEKNSFILAVAKRSLKEKTKTASQLLLGCKSVGLLLKSNNRYDSIWILCCLVLQVWTLAGQQKTPISVELWAHRSSWYTNTADVLKVSSCLQGLVHVPGKPLCDSFCDSMDQHFHVLSKLQ